MQILRLSHSREEQSETGSEEQKRKAENRNIEKEGKTDVSWDSMMDGCIRRLKVDPRSTFFLGESLGL